MKKTKAPGRMPHAVVKTNVENEIVVSAASALIKKRERLVSGVLQEGNVLPIALFLD